ncbi:MAG TPA: LLM class flavin-dependent oxidoreductase, partial [Verrucomicrobiae bacterium]|nr:LLM class flavin-dependent oxidoreductase [Verrucomicrobiae bacterium]
TARLRVLPRPIQSELPIWVTASGNPETFVLAGKLGANVLTHLLGQNPRELKEKIGAYREARRAAGHQGPGHVTLMLHTFVGETVEAAREIVRAPFTNYLRSSIDLIKNDPEAFSTFKPAASAKGTTAGPSRAWTEDERDAIAAHAFDRYFDTSGLFGNPFDCARKIEQFARMGVDEVACLIDFGVPEAEALAGLERLNKARKLVSETGGQSRNAHPAALEMRRHGVTHLQCTPSMAAMLLEDPAATESVAALKKLLLGGEALPLALLKKLPAAGQVLNMYGPTETTIWSATDTLDTTAERVTIGRPIANTQIYIVDKWLQPLPPGLPGELLIGGEGVVRGYLHRPDLTAEKFIPNSFDPTGSSRLYRTGDLARYLPDGLIEFLGRLDHQVKLRGFRIELGEVEAVVCRHDSARECVAIVREDTPGDKRLVAYLVPSGATKPDVAALRAHCRASLPEYMVPSAFVSLHSLPLTPNGKVDRKALPAPVVAGATAPRASDALSIAEQKIARVYRELLGVETVRREDNFFELGGNSVLATQLITRLREVFGSDLPLRLAFEHPRVESLATAVDSAAAPQHHESGPREIRAIERNGPLPLSFAQQRIWFLHQLEPGSHYNDHFDLRLGGPLRIAEIERAINEIIRRHETLRSTFHKGEAGPVLRILPEVRLKLDVIDFSALPAEIREQQAIQAAVSDCQQPFDLETGPLLRASLVKLAGEDHLLVLTFDHIVIDGWSHGVFLSELTALYEAFVSGRPSPLSALTAQYTDFAAWQQSWFKGANIENHLAYWRAQLKGAPPLLELPTDHPRPAAESFHGARHFLHLDRALVDGLSGVARRERCTLFMVFLAAFQTLLGKYAETEDVIVGSPIANRNRAETEPLIGPFMNTLALRGDLRGDPSFGELLSRARKTCLDAYAHQDLPFEQLVADLQPPRNPSHSPVFQVMFILQNTPMPPAKAGNLSFRHFDVDAGTSKLDLTLNLEETPEGAVGWIEYATALFEPASIAAMARHFTELLRGIAANSGERLSQLRLAPEGQEWKFPCGGVPRRGGVALVGTPAPAIRGELIPEPEKVLDGASFTAVQREMIGIWRDVLGVAEISLEDNLFDLGGHSLLITRIISRIRKTLGVELAIHVFFETPTVAGVAAAVEAELAHPEAQSARAMGIPKLARA